MPVPQGNLGLDVRPRHLPARARQFVDVAEVAELHHVVDANPSVALIIVVGRQANLFVHVPLTVTLFVLIVAHVIASLYF